MLKKLKKSSQLKVQIVQKKFKKPSEKRFKNKGQNWSQKNIPFSLEKFQTKKKYFKQNKFKNQSSPLDHRAKFSQSDWPM